MGIFTENAMKALKAKLSLKRTWAVKVNLEIDGQNVGTGVFYVEAVFKAEAENKCQQLVSENLKIKTSASKLSKSDTKKVRNL